MLSGAGICSDVPTGRHTNSLWSTVIAVPEPCLDSFVFLRVKERQENIMVEPESDDQRYSLFLLFMTTRWRCYIPTIN